jgi:Tubulin binding cofactor C
VAAVKNITAVDKCEKINLTVASNMIRIGNTLDSKFYTFSTYEPILFGDNKSLFLAPNNANYVELFARIKEAKIDTSTKSQINFAYPFIFHEFRNVPNVTFTIEQPKNFYSLILPNRFMTIPCPLSKDTHLI